MRKSGFIRHHHQSSVWKVIPSLPQISRQGSYGHCFWRLLIFRGFRYVLILVDVVTGCCWIYRLTSLTSNHVISALESFYADANGVPKKFHSDSDTKLIGGQALKWIHSNNSKIIAANAGRQSSNGLAKCTWRTLITMARA